MLCTGNIFKGVLAVSFFLSALVFGSCERTMTDPEETGETVQLRFDVPTIEHSTEAKASVDGSNFPYSHEAYPIGLWLMRQNSLTVPQIKGFDNLRTDYQLADGVNVWTYYPFGTDWGGQTNIEILKSKALDIYSYYPWVEDASDLTRIPFTSGEDDWMVATPVRLSSAETGSDVQAGLAFQHLMTCIEVRIQCRYEGSISLTSMTLTDSEGRLIASGTFDCSDMSVRGDKVNSITVSPNRSLRGGYWISTYIMMPPVDGLDLASGEMKLSFVFNRIAAETVFILPAVMKVAGSDQTITSFEKGYKYIYNLMLDNTMDFIPVGVEQLWTIEDIPLPI